jgi:hypothetical protein
MKHFNDHGALSVSGDFQDESSLGVLRDGATMTHSARHVQPTGGRGVGAELDGEGGHHYVRCL